jgi:hypothetical protein
VSVIIVMFFLAAGVSGDNYKPRRRSRAWVWFFVILGVLTAAAVSIEVWYNLQQQLTPESLAEARKKWSAKGPPSYHLEYTLSRIGSTDKYEVEVRGGKVAWAMRNGQLEEEGQFRYRDMPALFRFIADYLEQDSQPGKPRTYATATFAPDDGHVLHYTRSVMSKRERQEFLVTDFRPIGDTTLAPRSDKRLASPAEPVR